MKSSKRNEEELDRIFHALADSTRRKLLANLANGDSSVTDLARPFEMSLQAVMKHLDVLVDAGLVSVEKSGRVKRCHGEFAALKSAGHWVENYAQFWRGQLAGLED